MCREESWTRQAIDHSCGAPLRGDILDDREVVSKDHVGSFGAHLRTWATIGGERESIKRG